MNLRLNRRTLLVLGTAGVSLPDSAQPAPDWGRIEARARGQTVYFNAWGGAEPINTYIRWAGEQVAQRFGVQLEHVKVTDTADVVQRVRGEKSAARLGGGSVDLVWINGENFLTMKREGLLYGPFAEQLPAYAWVDVRGKPTTRIDFSEPVEGMEAPWGMAQLTFMVDRKRVPLPPLSMAALLEFAGMHPGRITYPRPPDFHGMTFLKQALLELHAERSALYAPATPAAFNRMTPPLWKYLDALHASLWRKGRQFPHTAAAIRQMMADGELLLAFTFNPNDAANEIAAGRLASSLTSYQFPGGTIANTHFLAIPFNASAREGAQVVTNFLLGAEAQARKADITVWGDPTVLDLGRLAAAQRSLFGAKALPGQVEAVAPAIAEPHASWVKPLEREWIVRYGI
jgi:putative thiamine transport system substrate-binding protein